MLVLEEKSLENDVHLIIEDINSVHNLNKKEINKNIDCDNESKEIQVFLRGKIYLNNK